MVAGVDGERRSKLPTWPCVWLLVAAHARGTLPSVGLSSFLYFLASFLCVGFRPLAHRRITGSCWFSIGPQTLMGDISATSIFFPRDPGAGFLHGDGVLPVLLCGLRGLPLPEPVRQARSPMSPAALAHWPPPDHAIITETTL